MTTPDTIDTTQGAARWPVLSVAPMMDWTDRWCRLFHRALSRHTLLYTEMVTAPALWHGDPARLLDFDAAEHPVALQIGGSDPKELAHAAKLGADWGYREINLNVGCPSERVQSGSFGACLMAEPELVRDCLSAMRDAVPADLPVTVKSRIGIDDDEGYAPLRRFVEVVRHSGVRVFIVHARKAILKGLSPKENREIPPLHYEFVHRLKAEYPELTIVLNGGLGSLDSAMQASEGLDGAMVGRAAYHRPYDILAHADRLAFGDQNAAIASRHAVVEAMLPVAERLARAEQPLARLTRHMTGLFHGQPGSSGWKRFLAENAYQRGSGPEVLLSALKHVPDVDSSAAAA